MLFSKSGHHPQSCNCHQSRDRLLKEVLSSLTEQEQEFGHFCSTRMNAIKTKTTFLAVKKKKKPKMLIILTNPVTHISIKLFKKGGH